MTDDMEVRVDAWKVSGFGNLGQTWLSFLLRGFSPKTSQRVDGASLPFIPASSTGPPVLSPHTCSALILDPLSQCGPAWSP